MFGGAILLVVLGHLTLIKDVETYSKIIYLFHMPLYFAISGFLYGYKEIVDNLDSFKLIKKKFVRLGIPYLLFSVVYVCFNAILQNYISMNTRVSLGDIFYLLWKPVAYYWFLWVLFVYFCVVAFAGKTRNQLVFLAIVGALIALFDGHCLEMLDATYRKALIFFVYFAIASVLGISFRNKQRYEVEISMWLFVLFLFGVLGFWALSSNTFKIEYTPVQDIFTRLFGIIAFSVLIIMVSKLPIIKKVLMSIGNYSWYIYLLHSYFLCAIRAMLSRIIPDGNPFVEIILGMSTAILGCVLIGNICKKITWLDCVFYPQRLKSLVYIRK